MCLGIPMRLGPVGGGEAEVELAGVRRRVRLDLVPSAREGDFVVVHAGYAIQVMDPDAARETLEALRAGQEGARR